MDMKSDRVFVEHCGKRYELVTCGKDCSFAKEDGNIPTEIDSWHATHCTKTCYTPKWADDAFKRIVNGTFALRECKVADGASVVSSVTDRMRKLVKSNGTKRRVNIPTLTVRTWLSLADELDATARIETQRMESEIARLRSAVAFATGRLDIVPMTGEGQLCVETRKHLLSALEPSTKGK